MNAKPIRPSRKTRARVEDAARAVGCDCKRVDVKLVGWLAGGDLQHVQVRHDSGCPALAVGRTAALLPDVKAMS